MQTKVEEIGRLDKKFHHRRVLPKTISIPKGSVLGPAPVKTIRAGRWYDLVIPIGNDHVAYLTLDDEALMALKELEPDVSIY